MENLIVGLRLTVYGMGIVFLLLGVLALVLAGLVRLDRPKVREEKGTRGRPASEGLPDPALLAAIMIAVRAHIRVRRKQAAPAMRSHQPGTLPSRWVASGRTRQNRSWAPGGRYV
ncbi:MAG TPA: OadG family transporter subunit [Vicinamibacteria bacterium]|nr:OadG family transporter subunit [Vicinamibacteria bacterium]